jgi:predicted PurR-regulated permease PerM
LLALTGVLVFYILSPFIYVLVFAVVFAVIFKGLHRKILTMTRQRAGISAALTTVIIILCIVLPLSLIGVQIFNEIGQLYTSLSGSSGQTGLMQIMKNEFVKLQNLMPSLLGHSFNPDQLVRQVADWLINNLGSIFSNVTGIVMSLFIFIVGLFYLLKDGQELKAAVIKFSPLGDKDDEIIFDKLKLAINSVVRGSIFVAFIQGTVATIGLMIFGVPNPFLWGSMAVMSALIPAVGTSLVMVPSIIYLFLMGQSTQGIGLIIWFVFAVSLIDNIVGPKIVSRGIKMHPFIIFLSIIGGLSYFGIAGFLLGPLLVSILFTLLDIYFSFEKKNT